MLHSIVQEQIAAIMVLPNRIPVQMASDVDIRKLRYPHPQVGGYFCYYFGFLPSLSW
jgi:hypothetical protein